MSTEFETNDDRLFSPLAAPPAARAAGGGRRDFLWQMGAGFAGLALTDMLARDAWARPQDSRSTNALAAPLAARPSHFPPRAKHVIFLFMYGGPTQVDTWDYKPELQRRDGQSIEIETRRRVVSKATLLASKRSFRRYGQSGLWGADVFPHLNERLDDICLLKSMYADTFAHGSALIQLNSGRVLQGSPSLGSWLTYGLGSENDNLPGYVVMLDPRGGPISGAANWSSGFMPAAFQGTHLRTQGQPILDLNAPANVTRQAQRELIDTMQTFNQAHLAGRENYSELSARIASYELAYQLQIAAPESMDISRETRATQDLYGIHDPPSAEGAPGPAPFGRQCLIARRLVERGVRFIQIYSGGGNGDNNWDAHGDVDQNLIKHAKEIDKPIAGLITDLKQRGLLDETLIVWGGEFGRQSVAQGGKGRDHNPLGFLYWLSGGGVRGGISHGETDELGHQAVVDRHHIRDLHATILGLMGLDHQHLTYYFGGLDHKLTGVKPARMMEEILK